MVQFISTMLWPLERLKHLKNWRFFKIQLGFSILLMGDSKNQIVSRLPTKTNGKAFSLKTFFFSTKI